MMKKFFSWTVRAAFGETEPAYQVQALVGGEYRVAVSTNFGLLARYLDLRNPGFVWPIQSAYYIDCVGSKEECLKAAGKLIALPSPEAAEEST